MMSAISASASLPQFNGTVVSSNDNTVTGLWSLPTESGGEWTMNFEIQPGYSTIYSGVLNEDDNIYYVTRCNAEYGSPIVYLDAYSMETGKKLWTNYPNLTFLPYDLTYNPYDGRIYGIFSNSDNSGMVLATVTYADQASVLTPICELEGIWVAIAAAADGELYGISSEIDGMNGVLPNVISSSLHHIDRFSGETSLIGETGQKPLLTGSATIDPRSGRMFWTVGPDGTESYLCEVDLTSGSASRIMDFDSNRQVTGIYAVTPPAEDKAPAEVKDAEAFFNGGELSGKISFRTPDTLFDGTPADGNLTYTIMTDGMVLADGNTSFGTITDVMVNVPERGRYTFTITVSNECGSSPKVNIDRFVGFGTPLAPENVRAEYSGQAISITWDAVSGSADGGYMDSADISYSVTRMSDNKVVASSIGQTSFVMDVDDESLQSHSFAVTADNNGICSEPGISNHVATGCASLPWTETFDDASSAGFFTVTDSNNDGKTWDFYSDRMRVQYGSATMDDWLISPALRLESGYTYHVSFKTRCANTSYPERIEAKWGNSNSVDAMTEVLVAPTEVNSADYIILDGYITPSQSGTYHIGIHGISDADQYYLEVDDISVETGVNMLAPAAPSELRVTPDPSGARKSTVSFVAPDRNLKGESITTLSKITLKRDGEIVKVFSEPVPGSELSTEDMSDKAGNTVYTAIATNEHGDGLEVSAEAFIGTPLVKATESVRHSELSDGEVRLDWNPVTLTDSGEAVDASRVRYNVYDITGYSPVIIGENIEGESFAFRAVKQDLQKFVQYAVSSVTDGGESAQTPTDIFPAGTPYTDFSESFAGGEASTIIHTERLNYGNWAPASDDSEVVSQDGDGGFIKMNAYFAGYNGSFETGKINLDGIAAPALSFYSYTPDNQNADLNTVEVFISADGGEWQSVFRKTVVEIGEEQGWHEATVLLNSYAGKTIRIRFFAETFDRPYTETFIDNIRIYRQADVDLQVSGISAPGHVRTGDAFRMEVDIQNNGAVTASGYDVEVYAGDRLCASAKGEDVASFEHAGVCFDLVMSPLAEDEPITYTVTVTHSEDPRKDNDSMEMTIVPVMSPDPAPESLAGIYENGMARLTWNAPVMKESAPVSVTDGFESAAPWEKSAPGWVFVDRDRAPVCAFAEYELPGISAGSTTMAFLTFSATDIFEGNKYLMPHSGDQYLVALARYDNAATDDWAISPELSGDAQTISFYAKSYHASYPERIETYYSMGSLNPDDFIPAGLEVPSVASEWSLYEADVPEGARYFAIRSCGTDSFMLMIDDATYTPASSHNIELLGYNVYRDYEKINSELVTEQRYDDIISEPNGHVWTVTAVYDRGESRGSEVVADIITGVESLLSGIEIHVKDRKIIINGAEGKAVAVTTSDAMSVYNGIATSGLCIDVAPGIYIINVNGKATKLMVK